VRASRHRGRTTRSRAQDEVCEGADRARGGRLHHDADRANGAILLDRDWRTLRKKRAIARLIETFVEMVWGWLRFQVPQPTRCAA